MATIAASSVFQLSPFGGVSAFGTYVRPWKNTIIGYAYVDSAPLEAAIIVFNPQMSEQLGSTISAVDGTWSINTIPKRYAESPLVAVMVPLAGSDAAPQIKTGIYPY